MGRWSTAVLAAHSISNVGAGLGLLLLAPSWPMHSVASPLLPASAAAVRITAAARPLVMALVRRWSLLKLALGALSAAVAFAPGVFGFDSGGGGGPVAVALPLQHTLALGANLLVWRRAVNRRLAAVGGSSEASMLGGIMRGWTPAWKLVWMLYALSHFVLAAALHDLARTQRRNWRRRRRAVAAAAAADRPDMGGGGATHPKALPGRPVVGIRVDTDADWQTVVSPRVVVMSQASPRFGDRQAPSTAGAAAGTAARAPKAAAAAAAVAAAQEPPPASRPPPSGHDGDITPAQFRGLELRLTESSEAANDEHRDGGDGALQLQSTGGVSNDEVESSTRRRIGMTRRFTQLRDEIHFQRDEIHSQRGHDGAGSSPARRLSLASARDAATDPPSLAKGEVSSVPAPSPPLRDQGRDWLSTTALAAHCAWHLAVGGGLLLAPRWAAARLLLGWGGGAGPGHHAEISGAAATLVSPAFAIEAPWLWL
jgi:hypothetical protein